MPQDNWHYGSSYLGFNSEIEVYVGDQDVGAEPRWSGQFSRRAWEYLIARYLGFSDFGKCRAALRHNSPKKAGS
jgi:hypothetical protein